MTAVRMSTLFGRTSREAPADAELPSHRLFVRAAMIRRVAAGVYAYLPLGLRALQKVENIIRDEVEAAGYQEFLPPTLHPRDLWEASGRWNALGPTLFRLRDRGEREFCLAFTNEELVTRLVAEEVRSYRQLPTLLYLIQRKFRDEPRPRGGLVRLREFLMKDAYSFDRDQAALDATYARMLEAYDNVFRRCGLEVVVAQADSGAMGGSTSHEVLFETPHGEDQVVRCDGCGYAANLEVAVAARAAQAGTPASGSQPSDVETPGTNTIETLASFLSVPPGQLLKAMLYASERGLVAAFLPGDSAVNLTKLERAAGQGELRPATPDEIREAGGIAGYMGPADLKARIIVDAAVATGRAFVTGANRFGWHRRDVVHGRDYQADVADLALVQAGDRCVRCRQPLRLARAFEVGHLFQLGARYSGSFRARFLDESGHEQDLLGASDGIGLDRLLAAVAEQHHDERGLRWPPSIAPFDIHVCALQLDRPGVRAEAERLVKELVGGGYDVLYDDRGESAGVQFADADLLGMPLRITLSPRTLVRGEAELKRRTATEAASVALDVVPARVEALLREER